MVSSTSPSNAQYFLIHIILSLGKYETEIDALLHPFMRDCLREVKFIGTSTDEDSLRRYSSILTHKYICEQVVFYPNSLNNTETFIIMSKRVFDDAIVHNSLAMNELPPFTMAGLRSKQTTSNIRFWKSNKDAQLQSIYSVLCHMNNIPLKEEIMNVNNQHPLS